jgi:hypothetical protein
MNGRPRMMCEQGARSHLTSCHAWGAPKSSALSANLHWSSAWNVALCEGFRMPAHDDGATHSGAGVE